METQEVNLFANGYVCLKPRDTSISLQDGLLFAQALTADMLKYAPDDQGEYLTNSACRHIDVAKLILCNHYFYSNILQSPQSTQCLLKIAHTHHETHALIKGIIIKNKLPEDALSELKEIIENQPPSTNAEAKKESTQHTLTRSIV